MGDKQAQLFIILLLLLSAAAASTTSPFTTRPGPQHLRRLSPGIPPPRPRHTRPRGSSPRGPAGPPPPPPCACPPLPRAGRKGLGLGKRG